ncbi:chaperonin 10-like protein [Aspergillus karnatakaensis]|uniref:NAD(P)-dependent alcohol dehydrogenase n=1 Tax=Aspergillus karnatakaensis TaxID=1810916 RepID=UPI003CCD073B
MTAPRTSKGQYLHGPKTLVREERPLFAPNAHEVQIAIRSTTLCGSDVHYYTYHRNGSIEIKEPLCGGHEAAGEIIGVGAAVANLKVGDKVAIESGVPCEECEKCRAGKYNVCPRLRFRSSGASFPHFQGTLQEFVNHPAAWCHVLPESLSFDDGALLEPLSVCIHAVRKARMERNMSCLVFGAGAVGLLSAAVAKIEYGARVVIADIDASRVDFAVREGFADVGFTVVPKRGVALEEKFGIAMGVAGELGKLKWPSGGEVGGFDVVMECTGVESCVQSSIYAADSGGKVVLIGMGTPIQAWPISELTGREIDVASVWRYAFCYPRAIELMNSIAQGDLAPDVRKLITHKFYGLDSIPEAYETAAKTKDAQSQLVIKTVVNL